MNRRDFLKAMGRAAKASLALDLLPGLAFAERTNRTGLAFNYRKIGLDNYASGLYHNLIPRLDRFNYIDVKESGEQPLQRGWIGDILRQIRNEFGVSRPEDLTFEKFNQAYPLLGHADFQALSDDYFLLERLITEDDKVIRSCFSGITGRELTGRVSREELSGKTSKLVELLLPIYWKKEREDNGVVTSLIELNILGYHGKCIKAEVEMGRGSIASVFCDFDRDKSMRGSIIDLQMGFRRDKMNDDNSVNIRLEPVLSGSYKEGFINVNTKLISRPEGDNRRIVVIEEPFKVGIDPFKVGIDFRKIPLEEDRYDIRDLALIEAKLLDMVTPRLEKHMKSY